MARFGGGIKLTGEWDRFLKLLDPDDFEKRLRRNIRVATRKNALMLRTVVRKRIQARDYTPNAPSTLAAKAPKDKPLVDTGALFGAITAEVINDYVAFVGVKRGKRSPDGEELVNIAAVLHEGATIKIGSRTVIIPARPFIRAVIGRRDVQAAMRKNWNDAIAKALVGK